MSCGYGRRMLTSVQIRLEPGKKPSRQRGSIGSIQDIPPPLSLQDLCLLRVINDVDSYPVELLSSLPQWLRNLLLSNLPVLDLCQLDHTPIARGVDIDKIWMDRVKGEPEIRTSFSSRVSGFTLGALIDSLFQMNGHQRSGSKIDERRTTVKKEMEAVFQGLYDHYNKEKFRNGKEEYLINLTAYALSRSDTRNVAHKLACLYGPLLSKRLQVAEKNVWETQATSLAVLGLRYSSTLCQRNARVLVFLTPYRLLPICENADSFKLLSLLIHGCKTRPVSICLDIDQLSQPFLDNIQDEKIVLDNGLALTPERVSCLSMMSCLLENVVILRIESQKLPNITGPMIALVEAAINRGKLQSLFCSIPNLYMEIVPPFSNLFHTKSFHMLHLELGSYMYSTQAMIMLLQAFMTAPCKVAQKLIIDFRASASKCKPPVFTNQQIATLNMDSATVPKCAVHHKMLQTNSSEHVLLYLLLLPCIRITELSLDYSTDVTSSYHLCLCHPNLHVKKVTLNMNKYSSDTNKLLDAMIANDVQILLNKPALQELVLTGDWEGRQEAKKGLIQGLQQQKAKPELQLNSLTLSVLGYSDEEIQTLLEMIASFPEDRRPRVHREQVSMNAAKKSDMDYTYDKTFMIQEDTIRPSGWCGTALVMAKMRGHMKFHE